MFGQTKKADKVKEKLYLSAFKLFLQESYEKVTISRIEKASGLTRGGIFYYIASKEELFVQIFNHYIDGFYNSYPSTLSITSKDAKPLKKFLSEYYCALRRRQAFMESLNIDDVSRGYFSFAYQASKINANLKDKILKFKDKELRNWKDVVTLSIESGEIHTNISPNIIAQQFCNISYGIMYQHSLCSIVNVDDVEFFFESYYNLLL